VDYGFGAVRVGLVVAGQAAVIHEPAGWVGRAARCLPWQVLFRTASRRTGHDGFPVIRLSRDHGVNDLAVCASWMWSWQASQARTVLRRRSSMTHAQSDGGHPSGMGEVGEGTDVMHLDIARGSADLAGVRQDPSDQLLVRIVHPDRPSIGDLRRPLPLRAGPKSFDLGVAAGHGAMPRRSRARVNGS
jgi:hypothetical protein